MRIIFFVGENGGDYFAIQKCIEIGLLNAEIVYMLSMDAKSKAINHFSQTKLNQTFISADKKHFFKKSQEILNEIDFDYIILSGFKFILAKDFVSKYSNRIINSHHSVLPAHPGLFLKEKLVDSDDKFLGATVHFIDEGIDTGNKIIQGVFPNYGMENFDYILKIYRFVQDVLILQTVRNLSSISYNSDNEKITYFKEILFNPKIDKDIIDYFWRREFE